MTDWIITIALMGLAAYIGYQAARRGPLSIEQINSIVFLTQDEGDAVTFLCENPEGTGPDNHAVGCCGGWTDWKERRFYAHTSVEALRKAVAARREGK